MGTLTKHAPVSLPTAAIEVDARPAIGSNLPWRELYVPLALVHGTTRVNGTPAKLLVTGDPRWNRYFVDRLLAAPQWESLGRVPLWRLAGVLQDKRAAVDLTLARIDRWSQRLFFDRDYLVAPEWVGTVLHLPFDLPRVARRHNSVAEDWRRTRRQAWSERLSQDPAELESTFYPRMYLPYTRQRYGEDVYLWPLPRLRRALRRGGLFWLQQREEKLAGMLFERRGNDCVLLAMGVADGDVGLLRRGVIAALYIRVFEYLSAQGFRSVDLRGVRPSLADGLLQFKRKWGAALRNKDDTWRDFLVHWPRWNPVVAELLTHTPLIVRDQGGLSGLALHDQSDPVALVRDTGTRLWSEGLRRLYLLTGDTVPPMPPASTAMRVIGLDALGAATTSDILAMMRKPASR